MFLLVIFPLASVTVPVSMVTLHTYLYGLLHGPQEWLIMTGEGCVKFRLHEFSPNVTLFCHSWHISSPEYECQERWTGLVLWRSILGCFPALTTSTVCSFMFLHVHVAMIGDFLTWSGLVQTKDMARTNGTMMWLANLTCQPWRKRKISQSENWITGQPVSTACNLIIHKNVGCGIFLIIHATCNWPGRAVKGKWSTQGGNETLISFL